MKKFVRLIFDKMLFPITYCSCLWLKIIRRMGIKYMKLSKNVFNNVGIFPIRDHFYEPLFNEKHLKEQLDKDRSIPGIDFNISTQLELLKKFNYNEELQKIPRHKTDGILSYYYNNESFGAGDAEFLYNMIRYFKPKNIVEIGCGFSSLLMQEAIKMNLIENSNYSCNHVCIDPYVPKYLEKVNAEIISLNVEKVEKKIFENLYENDILFIDSSHMIRAQGDVLFEYLQLIPKMTKGVLIHIHDIFTPKDYPKEWVIEEKRLWNEQYLLEAFLSFNESFEIVGSLNYLENHYYKQLSEKCPVMAEEGIGTTSFWIRKL